LAQFTQSDPDTNAITHTTAIRHTVYCGITMGEKENYHWDKPEGIFSRYRRKKHRLTLTITRTNTEVSGRQCISQCNSVLIKFALYAKVERLCAGRRVGYSI
jgi:hypothetical protein